MSYYYTLEDTKKKLNLTAQASPIFPGYTDLVYILLNFHFYFYFSFVT